MIFVDFITLHTFVIQVGKLFSSLGYTVAFGAVLVKMWRVYIIFHNPGAKRRVSFVASKRHCCVPVHYTVYRMNNTVNVIFICEFALQLLFMSLGVARIKLLVDLQYQYHYH